MKVCKKCKKDKPLSEFSKNKNQKDGLGIWCSGCKKDYKKYYYSKNKENLSEYIKKYYKENCERIKNKRKSERKERREIVLKHFGSRCSCCGESLQEFLSIDHINNDGNKHRKIVHPSNLYKWLIKNNFPNGFQLLCHNCNWAKHQYGICPHINEAYIDEYDYRA